MPKKTAAELAKSREKSIANLKRGGSEQTEFKSGRQAAESGRKGGLKTQKKAREERTYREMLEIVLAAHPVITPRIRDNLIAAGLDPDNGDYTMAFLQVVAQSQKAVIGDGQAYQRILEMRGEDPMTMLQQQALEIEKEALQQGQTGYSALDEAFSKLGSDEP